MPELLIKKKAGILLIQLIKFGIAGLPSFLMAIPLNWLMVEVVNLNKPLAYLITLMFQVTVNYFLLRLFVFKGNGEKGFLNGYFRFLWGIAFFRFLDWGLYTFLVHNTEIYYLFVQIGNVILFSLAKFFYSKRIMEK